MFKEDTQNELIGYISRMAEGEKRELLKDLKKKELYKRALELDRKQRAFNKGKKRISDEEICEIVRDVRRKHARKRA